jgi:hypothetical protein
VGCDGAEVFAAEGVEAAVAGAEPAEVLWGAGSTATVGVKESTIDPPRLLLLRFLVLSESRVHTREGLAVTNSRANTLPCSKQVLPCI